MPLMMNWVNNTLKPPKGGFIIGKFKIFTDKNGFGILMYSMESNLPNRKEISKKFLVDVYVNKKLSSAQISKQLKCSQNKVNYWLNKYDINKRDISEAIYQIKNPLGDPFLQNYPKTLAEGVLFGLGLGIYWGEGLKRGRGGLRLTNTDPKMVKTFINFLVKFYNIDRDKLRFSIQIFKDIKPINALNFWCCELGVKSNQFYKTIISKVRGDGTYKYRSEHGVIIIYFNNVKLKKLIIEALEKL
jgi:hypothetical protein